MQTILIIALIFLALCLGIILGIIFSKIMDKKIESSISDDELNKLKELEKASKEAGQNAKQELSERKGEGIQADE